MVKASRALLISNQIYRLLLFAYPVPFRHEFGEQMAQVFRDECRQAIRQTGLPGMVLLWLTLFPDLVRSALAEHIWEVFNMPVEKFLRGSGLAAIIAGCLWILLFVYATFVLDWDTISNLVGALIYIATMLLFALGLAGLQRQYPSRRPVQASFGIVYVSIVWLIVSGPIALFTEQGWIFFISGFYLFALGLLLIGVSSFIAGAAVPWGTLLVLISVCLVGFIVSGDEPSPPLQKFLGTAYGLGWVALGFMLWRKDASTPGDALPT